MSGKAFWKPIVSDGEPLTREVWVAIAQEIPPSSGTVTLKGSHICWLNGLASGLLAAERRDLYQDVQRIIGAIEEGNGSGVRLWVES